MRHLCVASISLIFAAFFILDGLSPIGLMAQNLPVTHERPEPVPSGGNAFAKQAFAGDIDGDGHGDYFENFSNDILGAKEFRAGIVSGRTHLYLELETTFLSIPTTPPTPAVTTIFGALGDVDGDGLHRYAAARNTQLLSVPTGSVISVYEGHPRVLVFEVDRSMSPYKVQDIQALGDVNDDGAEDFGVSAILSTVPGVVDSYVFECLSGVDGALIHNLQSDTIILDGMADMGDVNGDGHSDFALSSGRDSTLVLGGGSATIFSGADLTSLRSWNGLEAQGHLGNDIAHVEDLDLDGRRDIVILTGMPGVLGGTPASHIRAYASVTGNMLWEFSAGTGNRLTEMREALDLNGDGYRDFIAYLSTQNATQAFLCTISGLTGDLLDQQLVFPLGSLGTFVGVGTLGDTNGDGIAEISTMILSPDRPVTVATSFYGAEPYGESTVGSGLELRWIPSANGARNGMVQLAGCLPNSNVFLAVSVAPSDGGTLGSSHPLWVSPFSEDLILTANVLADGSGTFQTYESLSHPVIAGVALYIQAAQLTQPDAVSNGLQLLYGP